MRKTRASNGECSVVHQPPASRRWSSASTTRSADNSSPTWAARRPSLSAATPFRLRRSFRPIRTSSSSTSASLVRRGCARRLMPRNVSVPTSSRSPRCASWPTSVPSPLLAASTGSSRRERTGWPRSSRMSPHSRSHQRYHVQPLACASTRAQLIDGLDRPELGRRPLDSRSRCNRLKRVPVHHPYRASPFSHFARWTAHATGHPLSFVLAVAHHPRLGHHRPAVWIQRHLAVGDQHRHDDRHLPDGLPDPEHAESGQRGRSAQAGRAHPRRFGRAQRTAGSSRSSPSATSSGYGTTTRSSRGALARTCNAASRTPAHRRSQPPETSI